MWDSFWVNEYILELYSVVMTAQPWEYTEEHSKGVHFIICELYANKAEVINMTKWLKMK